VRVKEDDEGNPALKDLLLPFHQLDSLHRLGGVEMGALGRNDDEVGATRRFADASFVLKWNRTAIW
jgi:hypothetical protein